MGDTLRKSKMAVSQIMDFAIQHGLADHNPVQSPRNGRERAWADQDAASVLGDRLVLAGTVDPTALAETRRSRKA
jgi:hypothetical protein